MCGFVGFIKNGNLPTIQNELKLCLSSIQHRGKDYQQSYTQPPFFCAQSRLKIIDLDDTSNQPFSYNNQLIVLFNGEIYNYLQLRSELKNKGYNFSTLGDTEVIAAGFIEWGVKLFEKLDGMFALSIYDLRFYQIIMARDIFGKKPLYYSTHRDFTFCSELDAFKILFPDLKVSLEAINQFLSIGYTLCPTTIYEDVFLLPPASFMIYEIDKKCFHIHEYYSIENQFTNKHQLSTKDIILNTKDLLTNAIKKRWVGDVEGGIFLSSGLDSCAIAALSSRILGIQTFSFTISFKGTIYDESEIARQVANYFNFKHYNLDLNTIDLDEFNFYLTNQDYLTFDNSSYPIYKLSEFASKKVGYVLTGDGGDELFGGYTTYRADQINHRIKLIIPLLKNLGILKSIQHLSKHKNDKVGFLTKINRLSKGIDVDERKSHYQWRMIFSPEQVIKIMGDEHREFVYDTDPYRIFQKKYDIVQHLELKHQHMYVDIKTWLTDNNLIKLDRNTMSHSLEARSPFLDKDLFEFVAACPVKYKSDKYLLKQTLSTILSDEYIHRKKSGFNSPVYKWFELQENEFEFYTRYIYTKKYKQ